MQLVSCSYSGWGVEGWKLYRPKQSHASQGVREVLSACLFLVFTDKISPGLQASRQDAKRCNCWWRRRRKSAVTEKAGPTQSGGQDRRHLSVLRAVCSHSKASLKGCGDQGRSLTRERPALHPSTKRTGSMIWGNHRAVSCTLVSEENYGANPLGCLPGAHEGAGDWE